MTPLGKTLFSGCGVFVLLAFAWVLWWGFGRTAMVRGALESKGWTVADVPGRAGDWTATHTVGGVTTTVAVSSSGVRDRLVSTQVRQAAETGTDDVLVITRVPALLGPDSALSSMLGFRAPPAWEHGTPDFQEACQAFASHVSAAERWLPPAVQATLAERLRTQKPSGVHVGGGFVEARWNERPEAVEDLEAAEGLLSSLRAAGARPRPE